VIKMLIEPTKEQVEKYLDFCYGLALDPTRSGYPTYTDGVKTREYFEDTATGKRDKKGRSLCA